MCDFTMSTPVTNNATVILTWPRMISNEFNVVQVVFVIDVFGSFWWVSKVRQELKVGDFGLEKFTFPIRKRAVWLDTCDFFRCRTMITKIGTKFPLGQPVQQTHNSVIVSYMQFDDDKIQINMDKSLLPQEEVPAIPSPTNKTWCALLRIVWLAFATLCCFSYSVMCVWVIFMVPYIAFKHPEQFDNRDKKNDPGPGDVLLMALGLLCLCGNWTSILYKALKEAIQEYRQVPPPTPVIYAV